MVNKNEIIVLFAIISCAYSFNVKREQARMAVAYLSGPDGVTGIVTMIQTSRQDPLTVIADISGLSPGLHGFHVHQTGDLSGGCATLGGHFNPDNHPHGSLTDTERHAGDWDNLRADERGDAVALFQDPIATLYGPNKIVGRGIVVHEREDDLGRTDHPDSKTTGNSGGRVACGVIVGVFYLRLTNLPQMFVSSIVPACFDYAFITESVNDQQKIQAMISQGITQEIKQESA